MATVLSELPPARANGRSEVIRKGCTLATKEDSSSSSSMKTAIKLRAILIVFAKQTNKQM